MIGLTSIQQERTEETEKALSVPSVCSCSNLSVDGIELFGRAAGRPYLKGSEREVRLWPNLQPGPSVIRFLNKHYAAII
jgi:hypothetical protein